MKTSLLNRLQSPMPTAENTPQTSPVSTSEASGFSGLFQKAIGWLSPKSPANDSSNGTAPTVAPSLSSENSSVIPKLSENSNPVSLLTPLSSNGSKEIAEGLADTLGVTPESILQLASKGIVTLNSENMESLGAANTPQVQGSQSSDVLTITTDDSDVRNSDGLTLIHLEENQEVNPAASELFSQASINESGDIATPGEVSVSTVNPIPLEDVVASVYAAIQTNIPAENVDVTFLPTGKNSAEITLAIKNTSSENVDSQTPKTVDSHQVLEALSQHIGLIQKSIGASATVTFGINVPTLDAEQQIDDNLVVTSPLVNNPITVIPSNITQTEESQPILVNNNQITKPLIGKKLIYDLNPETSLVQDEDSIDNEETISVPTGIKDDKSDATIIQDNAMIAAAMLNTISQPAQMIHSIETEGNTEIETQNISSEKNTLQTGEFLNDNQKATASNLESKSPKSVTTNTSISVDSTLPFQNGSQKIADISTNEIVSKVKIQGDALPKVSAEVPSVEVSGNTVVNPLPKQSNDSVNQIIQPEIGTVISQTNSENSNVNSSKTESSAISNTVISQLNNQIEGMSLDASQFHPFVENPTPISNNSGKVQPVKTTQTENALQQNVIIETKDNEVESGSEKPLVSVSNQSLNNDDSSQISTEEAAPKTENTAPNDVIQKLNFNSVRELLDESAKNGITVNSLVIRVETPAVEVTEKQSLETNSPKIELTPSKMISSDTPKVESQLGDNYPVLKVPDSDKVQLDSAKSDGNIPVQVKPGFSAEVEPHQVETNLNVPLTNKKNADSINDSIDKSENGNPIPLKTETPQRDVKIPLATIVDTPKLEVSEQITVPLITPQAKQSAHVDTEKSIKASEPTSVKPTAVQPDFVKVNAGKADSARKEILSQVSVDTNSPQSEELNTIAVKSELPNASLPKSDTQNSGVQKASSEPVISESKQSENQKYQPASAEGKLNNGSVNPLKSDSSKTEIIDKGNEVKTTPIVEAVKPQIEKSDSGKPKKSLNEVQANTLTSTAVKTTAEEKPHAEEKQTTAKLDSPKIEVSSKSQTGTTVNPQNEEVKLTSPKTEIPVELKSNPTSINNNDVAPNLKVETPKGSAAKLEAVKPEMIVRENQAVNTAQPVQESIPSTVQTHDVSAIASAQKPVIAPKSETKAEKKATKIDSSEVTINSDSKEQLPQQVIERKSSNQNEQQKSNNKQFGVAKKNFESAIAQEVQSSEVEVPKEESISKSDSIRAKETAETNSPAQATNTALFQPVVAPVKNYQGIDSAKKTIPRVDVENFAPATAQLVKTLPQQTGGTVRMQLTPDALGPVTVQVNVRDKNAALRIDVETNAAKQALEAQIPVLREQLTQQGITAERIEIQVRPREDFSMFSGFNQQNSSAKQEEQQARQSYLRTFADGREERQEAIIQDIAPKIKEKKTTVQNRVEFYA